MTESSLPPCKLMTTQKPYHKEPMAYGQPIIGPRTYLARGPSGWQESFDRKLADQRLMDFLKPLEVAQIIEAFLERLRLEGAKAISWADVTDYLGYIVKQDPDLIPEIVGIAMWAQTILHIERRDQKAN
jgi:hypothetical protein